MNVLPIRLVRAVHNLTTAILKPINDTLVSIRSALLVPAMTVVMLLPVGSQPYAQTGSWSPNKAASDVRDSARDMRATNLIGKPVLGAGGERLGEIEDLMIDVAAQRVHYVILSFNESDQDRDKLFAYPIRLFESAAGKDALILNVARERLRNAPGFRRHLWPDWRSQRYRREIERYFDAKAVPAVPSGERMMRASNLIGKVVERRDDGRAGNLVDLVVNFGSGRARYAVFDPQGIDELENQLFVLPLEAFVFPRPDADLILNPEQADLRNAPAFEKGKWPDINAPAFRRNVDSFLSDSASPRRQALDATEQAPVPNQSRSAQPAQ